MGELNLDDIGTRYREYASACDRGYRSGLFVTAVADDVPALLAEVERLRAKLAAPCGTCHPCTDYRDETWRAADRRPPHVSEWDELRAILDRARADAAELLRRERNNAGHGRDGHLNEDDLMPLIGSLAGESGE